MHSKKIPTNIRFFSGLAFELLFLGLEQETLTENLEFGRGLMTDE